MQDIMIGDEILAYDEASKELTFSPVLFWLHRDGRQEQQFIRVRTYAGFTLLVTSEHIMLRVEKFGKDDQHIANVRASELRPGEWLLTAQNGTEVVYDKIRAISAVDDSGVYAPVTEHGTIVVQELDASFTGIVASCAVTEKDTMLFDFALQVMHAYEWLPVFSRVRDCPRGADDTKPPVAIRALRKLRDWLSIDYQPRHSMPRLT